MSQNKENPAGENGLPECIAGVRFQRVGKVYHFDASQYPDLCEGDYVVVTTSRGRQLGQVVTVEPLEANRSGGSLKRVQRQATGRDLAMRKHWESKEQEALATARALNDEVGLPIKLVGAEFSFDGKQLTFLYSAEERKETKPLRQRLSRAFRARVELRQIGPRDVAKILGGYGACGEGRCCATFLTEFSPISIRMAKAQGISLNPSEITGMCGRLRCCLLYEYEQYAEARKHLPRRGKRIGTSYGEGKVVSLLPLKETVLVDMGDRRVEVHCDEIMPLAEWRALQEQAAEASKEGQSDVSGRDEAPASVAEQPAATEQSASPSEDVEAESKPEGTRAKSKRSTSRHGARRKQAQPQQAKPEDDAESKSKSSRRRRRRRRR